MTEHIGETRNPCLASCARADRHCGGNSPGADAVARLLPRPGDCSRLEVLRPASPALLTGVAGHSSRGGGVLGDTGGRCRVVSAQVVAMAWSEIVIPVRQTGVVGYRSRALLAGRRDSALPALAFGYGGQATGWHGNASPTGAADRKSVTRPADGSAPRNG